MTLVIYILTLWCFIGLFQEEAFQITVKRLTLIFSKISALRILT